MKCIINETLPIINTKLHFYNLFGAFLLLLIL